MKINYEEYLDVAISAAKEAGAALLKLHSEPNEIYQKTGLDIVTKADLKSEQIIVGLIEQHFPDHAIASEEKFKKEVVSEYKWFIDPLDGTINYASGLATYGICITLTLEDEPIVAVVYAPASDELFSAIKSRGAYLNGQRLATLKPVELSQSTISICLHSNTPKESIGVMLRVAEKLISKTRGFRILISGGLEICYVATGRLHAFINATSDKEGHIGAGLILKEVGGICVNWQDQEDTKVSQGRLIWTHPELVKDFINILKDNG